MPGMWLGASWHRPGSVGVKALVGEGAEEKLSDAQGPSRRPACRRPEDPGAWGGAEATGDD